MGDTIRRCRSVRSWKVIGSKRVGICQSERSVDPSLRSPDFGLRSPTLVSWTLQTEDRRQLNPQSPRLYERFAGSPRPRLASSPPNVGTSRPAGGGGSRWARYSRRDGVIAAIQPEATRQPMPPLITENGAPDR